MSDVTGTINPYDSPTAGFSKEPGAAFDWAVLFGNSSPFSQNAAAQFSTNSDMHFHAPRQEKFHSEGDLARVLNALLLVHVRLLHLGYLVRADIFLRADDERTMDMPGAAIYTVVNNMLKDSLPISLLDETQRLIADTFTDLP